jgi:hypothetical protein
MPEVKKMQSDTSPFVGKPGPIYGRHGMIAFEQTRGADLRMPSTPFEDSGRATHEEYRTALTCEPGTFR